VKSAQTAIDNWNAGMRNPATISKYKAGIAAVTVSPTALAASSAAQQKYLSAVTQAVTSGRMAAKLNGVSLQQWQQQAQNIGANNLSMGAAKGLPKYTAFAQKWQPIWAQASQAAQAIPNDGSMQAALARVQAAITVMKQAAGKM